MITTTPPSSNISRRELLVRLGMAGAGIGLSSLFGCDRKQAKQGQVKDIRLFASGGFDIEKSWARLEKDVGLRMIFKDNGNDTGPIIAQATTGSAAVDYDVAGIQGGVEATLAAAGVIHPWDLSRIPNFAATWPWVKNIPYTKVQGKQFGIPIGVNADSIIYLPDKLKTVAGYETGEVNSYAAIFDDRLKGKTSMEDAWINSVIFTAIYLKGNNIVAITEPGNLTESELKSVMEFLIDKKKNGQFRKLWNGWEQGVELIRSGEVWAMTGWEPIVKAAQREGINARYASPKEGYEGWTQDLLLFSGAGRRGIDQEAHQLANWLLDGFYGATLANLRGYVVPNDRSVDHAKGEPTLDGAAVSEIYNNVRRKLETQVFWQNVRPDNFRLYEEWWSRLRNA